MRSFTRSLSEGPLSAGPPSRAPPERAATEWPPPVTTVAEPGRNERRRLTLKRLFQSLGLRGPIAKKLAICLLPLMALSLSLSSQEADNAAGSDDATPSTAGAAAGDVERGKYLVEGVGMCGQCHSPRDEKGNLQMDEWLHGGPVPVTTPRGYENWAYKAPRIAGLPQHTDEEFVVLMTTGINRDGKEVLAPMPPFRLTEADALAIAAYLRSLP